MSRKYAILLECDPGNTLGGSCRRDIENMANYLIDNSEIPNENIYLLTTSTYSSKCSNVMYESSKNIFSVVNLILSKNPELIVMLLTGHGYSVRDTDGDEIDGYDEAINVGFRILDDDIYTNIIKKLNCRAILLADTCHSGTMYDLPYIYDGIKTINGTNRQESSFENMIISLSACGDNQLSMCDIGDKTGFGGSLTTSLLNIDNVMRKLMEFKIDKEFYNLIQNRLKMLNQKLLLCSTQPFL